jgi:uncharacterized membrane protein
MSSKYKHDYDKFDKFSEIVSILLLMANGTLILVSLPHMPEIVPNHFNLKGEADGYGTKHFIWGPFIFAILLFAFFSILAKMPNLYNLNSTNSNLMEEYRLTTKMLITLKPVLILVLLIITFFMIQTTELKLTNYLSYLVGGILILIISHILYWVYRRSKLKGKHNS